MAVLSALVSATSYSSGTRSSARSGRSGARALARVRAGDPARRVDELCCCSCHCAGPGARRCAVQHEHERKRVAVSRRLRQSAQRSASPPPKTTISPYGHVHGHNLLAQQLSFWMCCSTRCCCWKEMAAS
jgi:hypothetical protein